MNIASAIGSGAPASAAAPSSGPSDTGGAFLEECVFQLAQLGPFEQTPGPEPSSGTPTEFATTLAGQAELKAAVMAPPVIPSAVPPPLNLVNSPPIVEPEQTEPQPAAPSPSLPLAQLPLAAPMPEISVSAPKPAGERPVPFTPKPRKPAAEPAATAAPTSAALPLPILQAPVPTDVAKTPASTPAPTAAPQEAPAMPSLPAPPPVAAARSAMAQPAVQPATSSGEEAAPEAEASSGFALPPSPSVAAAFILSSVPGALRQTRPAASSARSNPVDGETLAAPGPKDAPAPFVSQSSHVAAETAPQKPAMPATIPSAVAPDKAAPPPSLPNPPAPNQPRQPASQPAAPSAAPSPGQAQQPEVAFAAKISEPVSEAAQPAEPQSRPLPLKSAAEPESTPRQSEGQTHAQPDLGPTVPIAANMRATSSSTVHTTTTAPEARAISTAAPDESAQPQTVRQFALRIDGEGADSAHIRLSQRGSEVVVTVRGSDQAVTESLRGNLSDLTAKLESHGVSADVWQPASSSASSDSHERGGARDARGAYQDQQQSQNGQAGDGRRDRQSRPQWLDEEELATQMPRRQFK